MTVSSASSKKQYTGDGSSTSFPFPYPFFITSELVVTILNTTTNVETTKVAGTHYNVTGTLTDGWYPAGGNVVFTAGNTPGSNERVTIARVVAFTQETDFVENGELRADTLEKLADKLVMLSQQLNEGVGRAVKLPLSSTLTNLEIPNPVAGKTLKWKSDLTGMENSTNDPDTVVAQAAASAAAAAASAAAALTSEGNADTSEAAAAASAAASAAAAAAALASVGSVKVTTSDTTPSVLQSALVAGSGISFTVNNAGGDETLTIANSQSPIDQTARDIAVSAYIKADVAGNDVAGVYGRVFSDDFETDTIGSSSTNETYDASGKFYHNTSTSSEESAIGATQVLFGSQTYMTLDPSWTVDNGSTVTHLGVRLNYGSTVKLKLMLRTGAGAYTVVAEVSLSHTGDDTMQYAALAAPYVVPGSGAYYVGMYFVATGENVRKTSTVVRSFVSSVTDTSSYSGVTENDTTASIPFGVKYSAPASNMTLVSGATALASEPNDVSLYALVRDVDTVVNGTDRKIYASIDDGATWAEAGTYTVVGTWGATDRLIRADVNVSAQTGTSLKWKLETLNNKEQQVKQVTGFAA